MQLHTNHTRRVLNSANRAPAPARLVPQVLLPLLVALVGLVTLLPACRRESSPEPRPAVIAVEAVRVTPAPVYSTVEAFGSVSHSARVEIYPAVEARLVSVAADEGDRVTAGQILARLDRSRLEIARRQLLAQLASRQARETLAREQLREGHQAVEANMMLIAKAERELEQREAEYRALAERLHRSRQLHDIGGIPTSELEALNTSYLRARTERDQALSDLSLRRIGYRDEDLRNAGLPVASDAQERAGLLMQLNTAQLRSQLDVAVAEHAATESELQRLDMTLEETTVRSPINGLVATRNADPGARARPDQALFTVIETDRLYVQVGVAEEKLPQIALGARAALFIGRERQTVLSGTVHRITPYIDPGTRSTRVRILIDEPRARLVPGTFVRTEITASEPEVAAALPATALSHDSMHRDRVFVVSDGRAQSRLVTRIASGAAVAPEVSSFTDPDRVQVTGLTDGELVIVKTEVGLRDGTVVEARIQRGLK